MGEYTKAGLFGYTFSAASFVTLGWSDVVGALIIGFVGAIGGILANMIYQFLKKKFK